MRAVVCSKLGPIDGLAVDELPEPAPGPTEVVIEVDTAGFNFPDLLIVQGLYQFRAHPPFAPGGEAAGTVVEIGGNVTDFAIGDRVSAFGPFGAFAERWVVDQSVAVPLPDGIPFPVAAASTMTYGTSYHALVDRANLAEDETVLVLGAAGGVGSAAIDIAKALGATVVAAASTPEKRAYCTDLGADHVIDYTSGTVKDAVRDVVGEVDVIYDPVGGDMSEAAFRSIAWNGRHLVIGFAAGSIPALPLNLTLLKGAAVLGVFWGSFAMREPARNKANAAQIHRLILDGSLSPRVTDTVAFDDFARGLELIGSRTVKGKVLLDVAQGS